MTVTEAIKRGWSVIPVGLDKKPLIESWKPYQSHLPSDSDIAGWQRTKPAGWAVITEIYRASLRSISMGKPDLKPCGDCT